MDETLKRRLIGTAILLLLAFALISLLPNPQQRAPADDLQRVTIDLSAPEGSAVIQMPSARVTPEVLKAPTETIKEVATVAAAPDSASDEDVPPEMDVDAGDQRQAAKPTSKPELAAAPVRTPLPAKVEPAAPKPVVAERSAPPPSAASQTVVTHGSSVPDSAAWWVQAGSFSSIDNARKVESALKAAGQPTILAPVETRHGTLYRVRGGPYADEARARAAQKTIVDAGYRNAQLVHP